MTREEAKAQAERLGARLRLVSRKTTTSSPAGAPCSQLAEAKKHGVKMLTEDEWLKLISG